MGAIPPWLSEFVGESPHCPPCFRRMLHWSLNRTYLSFITDELGCLGWESFLLSPTGWNPELLWCTITSWHTLAYKVQKKDLLLQSLINICKADSQNIRGGKGGVDGNIPVFPSPLYKSLLTLFLVLLTSLLPLLSNVHLTVAVVTGNTCNIVGRWKSLPLYKWLNHQIYYFIIEICFLILSNFLFVGR